jgi:hypothetical protein
MQNLSNFRKVRRNQMKYKFIRIVVRTTGIWLLKNDFPIIINNLYYSIMSFFFIGIQQSEFKCHQPYCTMAGSYDLNGTNRLVVVQLRRLVTSTLHIDCPWVCHSYYVRRNLINEGGVRFRTFQSANLQN